MELLVHRVIHILSLLIKSVSINIIDTLNADHCKVKAISTTRVHNELPMLLSLLICPSIDRPSLIDVQDMDLEEHLLLGCIPTQTVVQKVQHCHGVRAT